MENIVQMQVTHGENILRNLDDKIQEKADKEEEKKEEIRN